MKIIQPILLIPLFLLTNSISAQPPNSEVQETQQPKNSPASYKLEKPLTEGTEVCYLESLVSDSAQRNVDSTPKLPLPCKTTSLSLGAFFQENKINAGIEGSITFEHSSRQASKLSIELVIKEKKGISDFFKNFSYTHYYQFGQKNINPYIGLGVVLGQTFNCTEKEKEEDECEETGLASIYPELGLMIRTKKLTFFPFIRRYDFNKHNTYGLSIGRRF